METVVSTVLDLFRSVHQSLREEVTGTASAALGWTPAPDTNSIAVLVVHTVGSEKEFIRIVRDLPSDRDRDAEFVPNDMAADALLERIAQADAFLDEVGTGITAQDLATVRTRPNREPQTGLYWLLNNYGHAREHLAHIQLTKQVYTEMNRGR